MIRLILIILTLIAGSYANDLRVLEVKVEHRDPSFDGTVSEGRDLLLFPVIFEKSFLTDPTFEKISEPINTRNDRLKLSWYPTVLAKASLDTRLRMNRCETAILNEDRLETPRNLAVFESQNIRFLQTFHAVTAFTLTNGENRTGKHLTLETEVWDTRLKGVVFRSTASVESDSDRPSDQEIILRCIELLYGTLPKFYFNSSERNW